jgi:sulfide dehydrogenase cytochrome subunit
MTKKFIYTLTLIGVSFISNETLAVDRGQLLADTCVGCHSGVGENATIPNLEQYPASLIATQMKAFNDGSRMGTVMGRHAKGYSEADIAALTKYLGIQGQ